jgi:hypothetical protein
MTISANGRTFIVSSERELVCLLFALAAVSRSTLDAYFLHLSGF